MRLKAVILLVITLLLLGLTGVSTAAALALAAPIHAGQQLFDVQAWAEHRYEALLGTPDGRAQFGLTLLERRIDDLEWSLATPYEWDALREISLEIDHAVRLFTDAGLEDETEIRAVFLDHIDRLLALLDRASYLPEAAPQILTKFRAQALGLRDRAAEGSAPLGELAAGWDVQVEELPAIDSAVMESGARLVAAGIDPRIVPFPPGSPGARHLFFPLDGAHSELSCQSCHAEGIYRGTPGLCSQCHVKDRPDGHYPGECVNCHATAAWLPASFDHALAAAQDCQSCHLSQRPADHYPGQCSACHSTGAWLPANFNHQAAGAADCAACHSADKPANHFSGQCSACHSTSAWRPATFNHQAAGATDCAACHSGVKPANHFSGQCSACHSTSAWRPATFNHQAAGATDCAACHSADKPANHFSGQCSACHSTSAWRPASFNHQVAGATDCQACHARPANHFPGQCSDCHSTSSWQGASFAHSFPIDHKNADGVCSKCHPSGTSSWTCFTCHNEAEMTKKHEEKGIPDYVARCMECHGDGRKHDD